MMEEGNVDYYALLELGSEATTKEIQTAYRRKSLKVHPDRNPDNPEAANLFHELNVAYEILIDPARRETYDKLFKAKQARAERFKSLDSKRKSMAHDLQAREEAFKRAKMDEREEHMELERLKSEGERLRRLKEEKHEQALREERRRHEAAMLAARDKESELGPLDTAIRLKWPRKQFPALELDQNAIRNRLPSASSSSVDSIVISGKMASNPKLKFGTAVVSFRTLSAAVRVVDEATTSSSSSLLKDIEVTWAAGQEPEAVRRAKERDQPHTGSATTAAKTSASPPPAVPPSFAFIPKLDEDSVLEQMRARERDRERERLEEEIRLQDAAEEEAAAAGR